MSTLLKMIYRSNAIPVKIPTMFFAKIEKPILKFICNLKRPQLAKTVLKKNKAGRLHTFCAFKTSHKAIVVKYSVVLA